MNNNDQQAQKILAQLKARSASHPSSPHTSQTNQNHVLTMGHAGPLIQSNNNITVTGVGGTTVTINGQGSPIMASNTAWQRDLSYPHHLFENQNKLIPAYTSGNSFTFMFHISVWEQVCKPNRRDYGIVWSDTHLTAALTGTLLFREGETLDNFNSWLAGYEKRFGKHTIKDTQLPIIAEGDELNGFLIKHQQTPKGTYFGYPVASNEIFEQWLWIVKNTSQPVYFFNDYWVFTDKSELIMFKLTENGTASATND
jgi:hypothetical protein